MSQKIKVLTLGDHPLSPSGVGIQTKHVAEALLKTGRYRVITLGGAMKHHNYDSVKVDPYGDDWIIHPVDGYGTIEQIRSLLRTERPDILWLMTDPRFYGWLWSMDNEIRSLVPMVYYHVWDNYPYPVFNKANYESNDVIASISKVTHDIVSNVAPEVENVYLPHSVDDELFMPLPEENISKFRKDHFPEEEDQDKVIFFWNNRNARRKQSGTLIFWFKEFLDEVGHENATLIMHTDPKDPHGQDLRRMIKDFDIDNGQVLLSQAKIPPEGLAFMYNMADCTINISDAEGFGLATLESLSCGSPIIVNMTGGLQEQVTDGKEWFGVGIEPSSKAVIGSQDVPYIYEDRISKEDFINALKEIYNMTKKERKALGLKGRNHIITNYNYKNFEEQWVELMDNVYKNRGSWEDRKNYNSWKFAEVV